MYKLCATVVVIVLFMASLLAQSDKNVRNQIQIEYDRLSKAFMARDVDTILSTLAADATLTYISGKKVTREQVETDLKASLPKLTIVSVSHKITQIRTVGRNIIATVNVRQVLRVVDKAKKPHTIEFRIPYRDTWTRRGAGWVRQEMAEAGKAAMLRDGASMKP